MKQRSLAEYLQDLRSHLLRIVIAVIIISSLCMTFSIDLFDFNGLKVPILQLDLPNNIASQVILFLKENLVPENVTFIQTAPGQAFFTQVYVAVTLGIVLAMPIIVREIAAFIGPALYYHEKAALRKIVILSSCFFLVGSSFSYFIVMPYVLDFLYKYGEAIGASTFFDISEFIVFVLEFLIIFGISYQFPVIMWGTTVSGIVDPSFWRNNLRYFIIIAVVFGAIVTPDSSGVTMWFMAGPMIALYVLGILFIENKISTSRAIEQY
jgi:sec-independent protein translocase protein TatC